jgi:hypothetical protein
LARESGGDICGVELLWHPLFLTQKERERERVRVRCSALCDSLNRYATH